MPRYIEGRRQCGVTDDCTHVFKAKNPNPQYDSPAEVQLEDFFQHVREAHNGCMIQPND